MLKYVEAATTPCFLMSSLDGELCTRQVTVWFQNKRQREAKRRRHPPRMPISYWGQPFIPHPLQMPYTPAVYGCDATYGVPHPVMAQPFAQFPPTGAYAPGMPAAASSVNALAAPLFPLPSGTPFAPHPPPYSPHAIACGSDAVTAATSMARPSRRHLNRHAATSTVTAHAHAQAAAHAHAQAAAEAHAAASQHFAAQAAAVQAAGARAAALHAAGVQASAD